MVLLTYNRNHSLSGKRNDMKLALRVTALLIFIVGIIWILVHPGFDALIAFLTALLALFGSFEVDNKKSKSETLDQRNRRVDA